MNHRNRKNDVGRNSLLTKTIVKNVLFTFRGPENDDNRPCPKYAKTSTIILPVFLSPTFESFAIALKETTGKTEKRVK